MSRVREHDFEPIPGLPERLPDGERILWQGAPRWRGFAVRAFHLKGLVVYFGCLVALQIWTGIGDGVSSSALAVSAMQSVALGAFAVALLVLVGWAAQRSTLYTITDRRVVLRVGVALPTTVNLPFSAIRAADLHLHGDGTGDIILAIQPPHRASLIGLWPHVRPWRWLSPRPMLRALPDASDAAQVLGRALALSAGQSFGWQGSGHRVPSGADIAPSPA